MTSVSDFLKSIGMAEYAAGLFDGGIDVSALLDLNVRDLDALGIAPDDRDRLLRAIAEFQRRRSGMAGDKRLDRRNVERRHLTILFCDLVGSTEISTRVDPETLDEIMDAYRKCCAHVILRAGGFVARYLGDGLLAYFGYPQANEDDAERAVNAGLALLEAVGQLQDDTKSPMQARVGIASGLVLIGDLAAAGAVHDHDVIGETPNLAARLQTQADPNTVIISGETRRLVGQLFECTSIDTKPLKGFAAPVASWRVIKPTEIVNRFRALRTSDTLVIGREQETDLILKGWESAKAGIGNVLLISGEPGIGKSRLVQTLLNRVKDEPHIRVRLFCSPNRQSSTLYPVIAQLQRAAGIKRDDTVEQRLEKLEATLRRATSDLGEALSLIAELLSIPTAGRFPALDISPRKRREKTLQALMAQIEGLARQPTLMVFEDVHWVDPTSLELLNLVVNRAPKFPLFFVVTFRPEFAPPWSDSPHVARINLERLPTAQSAELIAGLTREKTLPDGTIDQIVERTDGIPLFIEELTKVLVERGGANASANEIPATLRDMLTARLDRLGAAKEVAQIASIIGNEFSARLLSEVGPFEQDRLGMELSKLVGAEIVVEQGAFPSNSYRFKHALIQEAAYQSLVRSKRQQYHSEIAETLKARFPDIAEAQPELIAHHYSNANLREAAIPYLHAAAEKSMRRSANIEAIGHLTRAQEMLASLPMSPERLRQELDLQLALGTPLIATRGFASPEVGKVYARAREICDLAGQAPQLFPVLWGLWVFYTARAEHTSAHELAQQCKRMAESAGDLDLLMLAHHATGVTLSTVGEHVAALRELNRTMALYDREKHAPLAFVYGQDSGVVCRSQTAFSLWFQGFPEQALRKNAEALALARELSHPYSLAAALDFSTWIHQLAQNSEAVQKDAEAALIISTEREFVFWLLTAMILRGWALSANNQVSAGIALMRQGLVGYKATGARLLQPYYSALLAQALTVTGADVEAMALLDEAEAMTQSSGEGWFEAELYRLKGETVLRGPTVDRERIAEDYFRKALEVAVRQGAKSLELRAAASLARLWMRQGKPLDARRRLAEVYNWFTEGFDLPDLREARRLLQS